MGRGVDMIKQREVQTVREKTTVSHHTCSVCCVLGRVKLAGGCVAHAQKTILGGIYCASPPP